MELFEVAFGANLELFGLKWGWGIPKYPQALTACLCAIITGAFGPLNI